MNIKSVSLLKFEFIRCEVAPYGPDAPLDDFIDITYEAQIGIQEVTSKYLCGDINHKTIWDIKQEIIESLKYKMNHKTA